jgi:hypothetical protein
LASQIFAGREQRSRTISSSTELPDGATPSSLTAVSRGVPSDRPCYVGLAR